MFPKFIRLDGYYLYIAVQYNTTDNLNEEKHPNFLESNFVSTEVGE